ncbi:hypothetical protein ACTFIU_001108 [Dictyostelium citrinum]
MKSIVYICLLMIACLFIGNSFANDSIKADALECDMCNFVTNWAEEYVTKNATEQEIIQKLEDACNLLPKEYAQDCIEIINNYGVLMIRLLINRESPENVCLMMELCSKSSSELVMPINVVNEEAEDKVEGSGECLVCEFITAKIATYLEANQTETQILQYLDKDCNFLKSSNWISTCQNLIQEYEPQLIAVIEGFMAPSELCEKINFCSSGSSSSSTNNYEYNVDSSTTDCEICTFITGYADSFLEENKTLEDIIKVVDDFCKIIPAAYKTDCVAMAANYIPAIVKMLENDNTPAQVCQKLNLCPAPTSQPQLPIDYDFNVDSSTTDCEICTFITGYADSFLEENKTLEDIIKVVDDFCKIIPAAYKTDCVAMAANYIPAIVKMLENDNTPAQVCQKLNLCPAPTSQPQLPPPSAITNVDIDKCEICETIIGFAEKYLGSALDSQTVKTFLLNECDKLPGVVGDVCNEVVNEYLEYAVTQLEAKFNPTEICQLFSFCAASSSDSSRAAFEINIKDGPYVDCQICDVLANFVVYDKNYTTHFEDKLNKLCNCLSRSLIEPCLNFVSQYGSDLVQVIVQGGDSAAEACYQVANCPYSSSSSYSGSASGASSGSGQSSGSGSGGYLF